MVSTLRAIELPQTPFVEINHTHNMLYDALLTDDAFQSFAYFVKHFLIPFDNGVNTIWSGTNIDSLASTLGEYFGVKHERVLYMSAIFHMTLQQYETICRCVRPHNDDTLWRIKHGFGLEPFSNLSPAEIHVEERFSKSSIIKLAQVLHDLIFKSNKDKSNPKYLPINKYYHIWD